MHFKRHLLHPSEVPALVPCVRSLLPHVTKRRVDTQPASAPGRQRLQAAWIQVGHAGAARGEHVHELTA